MSAASTVDWRTLPAGWQLDALVSERVMGERVEWIGNLSYRADAMSARDRDLLAISASVATLRALVPEYTTSIAAAWLVVERLRERGLRPLLNPDWQRAWTCEVYREATFVAQSDFCDAPLAICRAALAAIEKLGAAA